MRKPAKPITEEHLSYFVYDESSPSCLRWKDTRYATFKLACEFRNKKLEELIAEGVSYTERHGL
jgi:hypothetical protein